MSIVELGDVEFDPVEAQDFRLSVEGTSGTGKTNTLAVILEDLAETNMPTLIVERLGALTTVRHDDDNIVVVGEKDEEGIDLAVPLNELDKIGAWVMDRGMKILLDVSTYADYAEEQSRVHLAAATAIRSLNDRAHERYRGGDRRKALLVIDEAQYMAPKDNAPEPDLDDCVKRCRGQIIKASTEGGNKGINTITAYQRRAFLHNGVIQLCRNWIVHGLESDDAQTGSKKLRIDREMINALGTGEILARGETITGGDLVGPTTVRKRRSPDPREDTFEVPDTPPELSDVLSEIQDEVESDAQRREERQDELEQLRDRVETLQDEKAELEQELQDSQRIAQALERIQQSGNGQQSAEIAAELEELEERKQEIAARVESVQEQKQQLQDELADKEARIEELQQRYKDDLAALNSLRTAFQLMGLGGDGEAVESVSEDQIERVVERKVEELDVGSAPQQAVDSVQDAILNEFQEEAVDRVMDKVDRLSDQQRTLLKFIEARDRTIDSMKDGRRPRSAWTETRTRRTTITCGNWLNSGSSGRTTMAASLRTFPRWWKTNLRGTMWMRKPWKKPIRRCYHN